MAVYKASGKYVRELMMFIAPPRSSKNVLDRLWMTSWSMQNQIKYGSSRKSRVFATQTLCTGNIWTMKSNIFNVVNHCIVTSSNINRINNCVIVVPPFIEGDISSVSSQYRGSWCSRSRGHRRACRHQRRFEQCTVLNISLRAHVLPHKHFKKKHILYRCCNSCTSIVIMV